MSKQVLSIEQMQHLQELGLELEETMMRWQMANPKGQWMLVPTSFQNKKVIGIPAYTLQDVLDALPEKQHITFKSNNEDVTELCDLALSKNTVWYECDIRQPGIILDYWEKEAVISYSAENLIDAAYSMLCWAIENKFVDTNKEKCCGSCRWFCNEDIYGGGWCAIKRGERTCAEICGKWECIP